MLKLSVPAEEFVRRHQLNISFFQANTKKVDKWILEAQRLCLQLPEGATGLVAPTSGGKTVIALLAAIISGKRTLMLVPIKRLCENHQELLRAMTNSVTSAIITGETQELDRIWHDPDDRIIFATGDVVQAELKKGELSLAEFEFVIFDEIHHAASVSDPYSYIGSLSVPQQQWWLALTASPGNSQEQIVMIKDNVGLGSLKRLDLPVAKQIRSIICVEETDSYQGIMHQKIIAHALEQMQICLDRMDEVAMQLPLGKPLEINPGAAFGYSAMTTLRSRIAELGEQFTLQDRDQQLFKKLTSMLQEYAFWAHCYDLVSNESYQAFKDYYSSGKFAKKRSYYAARIRKQGNAQMLIAMGNNLLHPKLEALGTVMDSVVRRGKQAVIFTSNKSTGRAAYEHLQAIGIRSDLIYAGQGMTQTVQQAVKQKLDNREVDCLISTNVLREGFSLTSDVVIHLTPPKYPVDYIQRNGRAGRREQPGEIIYITTAHERPYLFAVSSRSQRLSQVDLDRLHAVPVMRRRKPATQLVLQPSLF